MVFKDKAVKHHYDSNSFFSSGLSTVISETTFWSSHISVWSDGVGKVTIVSGGVNKYRGDRIHFHDYTTLKWQNHVLFLPVAKLLTVLNFENRNNCHFFITYILNMIWEIVGGESFSFRFTGSSDNRSYRHCRKIEGITYNVNKSSVQMSRKIRTMWQWASMHIYRCFSCWDMLKCLFALCMSRRSLNILHLAKDDLI